MHLPNTSWAFQSIPSGHPDLRGPDPGKDKGILVEISAVFRSLGLYVVSIFFVSVFRSLFLLRYFKCQSLFQKQPIELERVLKIVSNVSSTSTKQLCTRHIF